MNKSRLKIAHVSHNDAYGGADRAGYRIHKALLKHSVESKMFVNQAGRKDPSVEVPGGKLVSFLKDFRPRCGRFVDLLYDDKGSEKSSPAAFSSFWPRFLNRSDFDIVHLHWPHNEMMSIADISKIKKPLVWTLHDMWAFSGAEHYTTDDRYQKGYSKNNRPEHEKGLDINRWNWHRKKRLWKKPMTIVGPSRWMADCAASSVLMKDWPIYTVKNTIDLDFWRPMEKSQARFLLGLPEDKPVILFGAIGGVEKSRKGFDLLIEALKKLHTTGFELEIAIIGQHKPEQVPDIGYQPHFLGHFYDDLSLKIAYNAANCVLLPSRQDNLPNMGVEALGCGVPVVAFNTCGLPDIVDHQKNGWLAKPFDTDDLAAGIRWVLKSRKRINELSENSRESAVRNFSEKCIAKKYKNIYTELLQQQNS